MTKKTWIRLSLYVFTAALLVATGFLIKGLNSGVPPGARLNSETYQVDNYQNTGGNAVVWVMAGLDQYQRPAGITRAAPEGQTEPPAEISNFDFSANILVFVFKGYAAGDTYNLKVKGLWRDGNTIRIVATYVDMKNTAYVPGDLSQYSVLKVSKDGFMPSVKYTFILQDESGKEYARTEAGME